MMDSGTVPGHQRSCMLTTDLELLVLKGRSVKLLIDIIAYYNSRFRDNLLVTSASETIASGTDLESREYIRVLWFCKETP